jgi:hypothetical protein
MGGYMSDETEGVRRVLVDVINSDPNGRSALEKEHGQVWDTNELSQDFSVLGFMAPFVVVKRKSDGVKGSLMFQHNPRYYFSFTAD